MSGLYVLKVDMLKKIVLSLSLVSLFCNAGTLATSPNNAGGVFVLTDVPCKGKKTLVAYTVNPNNPTEFGCWFTDDNFVHIIWDKVGLMSYPFAVWEVKKSGPTY